MNLPSMDSYTLDLPSRTIAPHRPLLLEELKVFTMVKDSILLFGSHTSITSRISMKLTSMVSWSQSLPGPSIRSKSGINTPKVESFQHRHQWTCAFFIFYLTH